jgi:hypothetical protein
MWLIGQARKLFVQERGGVMMTALFFIFCLCGLLSLLLFQEQIGLLTMRMQQTADVVTKGARAAGKWEYVNDRGEKKSVLFATTEEASRRRADIIRGAREEADMLWRMNEQSLWEQAESITAVHQKGERKYLYSQGVYHFRLEVISQLQLFWESVRVTIARVSQSGVYAE